uniref:Uncharacterized protein n=1 Tax=Cacopsylla melanoneura TaxID=428564 RepID=A0A8D8U0V0_9HEMI
MNHFLNRAEIGIVQVAQKPEDARSEHFAQEQNERRKIVHVDHAQEPMDEHTGSRGRLQAEETIFETRLEHGQRADVQPPAADEREDADFDDAEKGDLDYNVAESQHASRFGQIEERCQRMKNNQC